MLLKRFNTPIFVAALMISQLALAQEQQRYMVKAGTRPSDTFKYDDIYLYPSFQSGKVHFKNTHVGSGPMNFNRFTGEIDFVQGRDTLALTDKEAFKDVVVGNDVFYYQVNIGYIMRMEQTPYATLGKKDDIQLADRRRHRNEATSNVASNGSYNGMITTGAGTSSGLTMNMVEPVDLIYRRKTEYYFGNSKGFFVEASAKNIVRLFPDKRNMLKAYFDQHQIDFSNEQAMLDLFKLINESK